MNADLAAAVRLMSDDAARERQAAWVRKRASRSTIRKVFAERRRKGLEARHAAKLARSA